MTFKEIKVKEKQYIGEAPKKCDLCKEDIKDVFYDAKTKMGPWANMCNECYNQYGVGLGMGKGQKYLLSEKLGV